MEPLGSTTRTGAGECVGVQALQLRAMPIPEGYGMTISLLGPLPFLPDQAEETVEKEASSCLSLTYHGKLLGETL